MSTRSDAYRDFLSDGISDYALSQTKPVPEVDGLRQLGDQGGLETSDALRFLLRLHKQLKEPLQRLLVQRDRDRRFIDERTRVLYRYNVERSRSIDSNEYQTVLGLEDQNGRIVIGPLQPGYWKCEAQQQKVAPLPSYLTGSHITLFGPPDSAKMCVNAMNAFHRRLPGEPEIVAKILARSQLSPKWGADDEDSKTPIRADLISAGENLRRCFERTITAKDEKSGQEYQLQRERLALPIKRFPGLALPCPFLFHEGNPLPLHLYDFALHLFHNWERPESLVFYVPKLENEEEARYVHQMIDTAEAFIKELHGGYEMGTVRLMIVLENPRAVFRAHEIMDTLYPYFAGASMGWHDFLASTARLFKEDGNYRIPWKADSDIVIKYIKASHELLAGVVGPRGGIKIGGMYGILPTTVDLMSDSFQVTLKGYIRDVVTQLKRGLDGFWVAHPDFVRLGIALVESWRSHEAGDSNDLKEFVTSLLKPEYHKEILDFTFALDIESLSPDHPRYPRSLIVADLPVPTLRPQDAQEEVRYNVFQSLQYLADWLRGNGCVALPTQIGGIAVRVMDDLATAERSRWEVWHEIHHGRISLDEFLVIAHEEMHFIRKDLSDSKKVVRVKWDSETSRWYPTAFRLMLKLMTDSDPPEFATELLLPFTIPPLRDAIATGADPWETVYGKDTERFRFKNKYGNFIERFLSFFEICGHGSWAGAMARRPYMDLTEARKLVLNFNLQDVNAAAFFHGNIGEDEKTLDHLASSEQAGVLTADSAKRQTLRELGESYRSKFGMKFLVSAKGKSADQLLACLKERSVHSPEQELTIARQALWEITEKRLGDWQKSSEPDLAKLCDELRQQHKVVGLQVALSTGSWGRDSIHTIVSGEASPGSPVTPQTFFEIASLSKPIASAFAIDFFAKRQMPLSTTVNSLFAKTPSRFRLTASDSQNSRWADQVTLANLMKHEALNLHYVNGIPLNEAMPSLPELLDGNLRYKYDPTRIICEPGQEFHYSGGGFLVLEHLLESLLAAEKGPGLRAECRTFMDDLGLSDLTFEQKSLPGKAYAAGFRQDGTPLSCDRLMFPAFAAGACGTASAMLTFLKRLEQSFHDLHADSPLSHDTAVQMVHGTDKGSMTFIGARMGLGIFVAEAGGNRILIHQGANDGFRCLFLHCFTGPNRGQGFVAFANGELNAVKLIADIAQVLLRRWDFQGINFKELQNSFDSSGLRSEEVVNCGYRDLIFSAFHPCRPEPIARCGPIDPLTTWNRAAGSQVLQVTNERFARAENLVSPLLPVFEPDLYGAQGKVMDSWESARHSPFGEELIVLRLPHPTRCHFASVSTAFHLGNQVPSLSIEGSASENPENAVWEELLPRTNLDGHAVKHLRLSNHTEVKLVRIRTFPDGGLTRLGIFDDALPEDMQKRFQAPEVATSYPWPISIPQTQKPLVIPFKPDEKIALANLQKIAKGEMFNNASAEFGAKITHCSNQHYGPVSQIISPTPPLHMFDGFESARSRIPNHHEEVTVALAKRLPIERIEFDFTYFVNNNPRCVQVQGSANGGEWRTLVPESEVKAFAGNQRSFKISNKEAFDHVRVMVIPDGGIHRLRVFSRQNEVDS